MSFDVENFRTYFPSLVSGIAHFDGPGGTQTPRFVGQAIADALCGPLSNRGQVAATSERRSDDFVGAFRAAVGDLLNADPDGIVYGRSATQLTYDFAETLARTWGPGDNIIVTSLDHDANIRPWIQTAERAGAEVRWWEFDPATGELDLDGLAELLGPRTRLVAVTAASNLLGTMPVVADIAKMVHETEAVVFVDGVHYTPHALVDLSLLGADFFVCSAYKFMGPHCGVLAAPVDLLGSLRHDKLAPATDRVPERFERGTLPYETLAGVTAAVDFLAAVAPADSADPAAGGDRRSRIVAGSAVLDEHETALRLEVETALRGWDRVSVYSNAEQRTPTLFFTVDGVASGDIYRELAADDVLVPAGSFYASEAFQRLNLRVPEGLRVGIAPYNNDSDIERLLTGLDRILTRG